MLLLHTMDTDAISLLRRRNEELAMLLELNIVLNSTLELKELLNMIMHLATTIVNAEASALMLLDQEKQELYFDIALGAKGDQIKQSRLKIGEGIAGFVAQHGESLIIDDVSSDPRFSHKIDDTSQFVTKSILCVPLKVKNRIIGVMEAVNKLKKETFDGADKYLLEVFASQAAIAIENARLLKNLRDSYLGAINSLTEAVNAKDHYTAGHVDRVGEFALAIAKQLSLDKETIEVIHQAAVLHDVGKIGIPESVLLKPGKLTDEEFTMMKNHPLLSAKIVQPIGLNPRIVEAIKHHHERIDGRGYPDGVKGEEINIETKILCVADSYDAMTSDRPYRRGLSKETAVGELKKGSGTQFDTAIVEAFITVLSNT